MKCFPVCFGSGLSNNNNKLNQYYWFVFAQIDPITIYWIVLLFFKPMAFLRGLSILIISSKYLCDYLYLVILFHLFKIVFSLFLCYCFLPFLCLSVSPSCSRKMSGSSEDDSDFDITPWLAAPAPNFSPDSKSPHTLWDILTLLFSCVVMH